MTLRRFTTTAVSISAFAFAGCATMQAPSELVQARRAYSEAEQSEAARYDPAALHEAKTALDRAENMFSEDADAPMTRDAAYIAMRRAQRAQVEGETASLKARKVEATTLANQDQAKAADSAREELASSRVELAQATHAREAAEERAKAAILQLQLSKAAAVTEEPRGTVIVLAGAFLFRTEDATLMPSASEKLDKIVSAVKEQGNRKIIVEGHTDSRGADDYNMNLSKQRADSVANYLTSHGVAGEKVSSVGVGSTRPIASNDTPEGRATNRRVEITIQRTEPR